VDHSNGTATPRYGIKLATHYVSIGEALTLARRVDSLGYDAVWVTEGRTAPDAVTATTAMAAQTERVRLGTSVLNPYSRSPALLAITAAAIDQISRGRFVLGIGPGDPGLLERQGIPYRKPLTRLREYVHVVRELLAGKNVTFEGQTLQVTDLELDFAPYNGEIPVYIGATGPRALEQAIQIGDGLLLNTCIPRSAVKPIIGAARSRRGFRVMGNIVVCMDRDRDVAIRGAKPLVVNYLTRFAAIAKSSGMPGRLLERIAAAQTVSMDEACSVLPDDYVQQFVAAGNPDDCRRWISDYTRGMDEALLMPSFGDKQFIIDELAELL
jgi:5,10-methylenetetrahydromethanopterin reductase